MTGESRQPRSSLWVFFFLSNLDYNLRPLFIRRKWRLGDSAHGGDHVVVPVGGSGGGAVETAAPLGTGDQRPPQARSLLPARNPSHPSHRSRNRPDLRACFLMFHSFCDLRRRSVPAAGLRIAPWFSGPPLSSLSFPVLSPSSSSPLSMRASPCSAAAEASRRAATRSRSTPITGATRSELPSVSLDRLVAFFWSHSESDRAFEKDMELVDLLPLLFLTDWRSEELPLRRGNSIRRYLFYLVYSDLIYASSSSAPHRAHILSAFCWNI